MATSEVDLRNAHLYELFEDGEDAGMVVGGFILESVFEEEAKKAGHDETLRPLGEAAITLAVDTDN